MMINKLSSFKLP